jgi:hypothetical protein
LIPLAIKTPPTRYAGCLVARSSRNRAPLDPSMPRRARAGRAARAGRPTRTRWASPPGPTLPPLGQQAAACRTKSQLPTVGPGGRVRQGRRDERCCRTARPRGTSLNAPDLPHTIEPPRADPFSDHGGRLVIVLTRTSRASHGGSTAGAPSRLRHTRASATSPMRTSFSLETHRYMIAALLYVAQTSGRDGSRAEDSFSPRHCSAHAALVRLGAYLAELMGDVLVGRPVAHRRCTTALWISGTSLRLFCLDDCGTTTAAHLRLTRIPDRSN